MTPSRSFGDERSPLATDDEAQLPPCDDESFLSFCLFRGRVLRGQPTRLEKPGVAKVAPRRSKHSERERKTQ